MVAACDAGYGAASTLPREGWGGGPLGAAPCRFFRVAIATEILLNFLFWQMKVVAFATRGSRKIKTERLFHFK